MWKRTLTLVLLVAVALVLGADLVSAKGGKPKPPPVPVDGGKIYFGLGFTFSVGGTVWEMNPDGSGKTDLGLTELGEPSRAPHGSPAQRWFLQLRAVGGNPYPSDWPRRELFAVSEDGATVHQLTDDPNLEPSHHSTAGEFYRRACPRWGKDGAVVDGKVSYLGRRWAKDASGAWYVSEAGLFVLNVDPDNLTSYRASPTHIPVAFPEDFNSGYAWSPDGESFVYHRWLAKPDGGFKGDGIWRADGSATGWTTTRLTADNGWTPDWSSTGRIVFVGAVSAGRGIDTMNADGTDRKTIIQSEKLGKNGAAFVLLPRWSPNGTHLIYHYKANRQRRSWGDVYRATADGDDQTNLTSDTDDWAETVAWSGE